MVMHFSMPVLWGAWGQQMLQHPRMRHNALPARGPAVSSRHCCRRCRHSHNGADVALWSGFLSLSRLPFIVLMFQSSCILQQDVIFSTSSEQWWFENMSEFWQTNWVTRSRDNQSHRRISHMACQQAINRRVLSKNKPSIQHWPQKRLRRSSSSQKLGAYCLGHLCKSRVGVDRFKPTSKPISKQRPLQENSRSWRFDGFEANFSPANFQSVDGMWILQRTRQINYLRRIWLH